MGKYFGTDGIRGIYGEKLTPNIAFLVGNALCQIKTNPKVVLGTDTRESKDILSLALSAGIINGGGSVINVKIIPTAGISFLSTGFDYGIIITASHNPPQFNGIKIFDNTGEKLSDQQEDQVEQFMNNSIYYSVSGKYIENESLKNKYIKHLTDSCKCNLKGLTVLLDASNGAGYKIAPLVMRKLGAKVVKISCSSNGKKINENCGCLHIDNLQRYMKKYKADIGFAFDGDADRVIAVDRDGCVFDGDKLLYILAKSLKSENKLYANSLVGTSQTNSGIVNALNRNNVNLIRTEVGDKYVIEAMEKMNLTLGGEQSGHIIIKEFAKTGDGILTAIKICENLISYNKSLKELFDAKLIPQININLPVLDKNKIIKNKNLKKFINEISKEIEPLGRILVRASGTEDIVRVMVEHANQEKAEEICMQICNFIKKI